MFYKSFQNTYVPSSFMNNFFSCLVVHVLDENNILLVPLFICRSFYVGDAGGRDNDHSDADIKFAQVKEEFFSFYSYFKYSASIAVALLNLFAYPMNSPASWVFQIKWLS